LKTALESAPELLDVFATEIRGGLEMGATMGIRSISTLSTFTVPSAGSVSKRIRLRASVIILQMLLWQVFAMNYAAFSQTSSTGDSGRGFGYLGKSASGGRS
jgi:hypothetical protein